MLPEKNFNPTHVDDLRMENELKKIKMIAERGADFFYPNDQNDLPPEVEFEFLKHIEEFEKAHENCKRIPVYDFIGKPHFRLWNLIPNDEIHAALQEVMGILNENQIDLSTICEVHDRDLYHFITEELFLKEIDDMRMQGMLLCFIYEEFHPNHEYDIKNQCADFITSFLNKDSDTYEMQLVEEAESEEFLKYFRNSFDSFSLSHFSINYFTFNSDEASVNFEINFSGIIEGTRDKQFFIGEGKMELLYINGFWDINSVIFPSNANRKFNGRL